MTTTEEDRIPEAGAVQPDDEAGTLDGEGTEQQLFAALESFPGREFLVQAAGDDRYTWRGLESVPAPPGPARPVGTVDLPRR